jgi:hypothetical protein
MDGLGGPPLGARLESPAESDEGDDHPGGLEEDRLISVEGPYGIEVRGEGAQRDEGVHVRCEGASLFEGDRMELPPEPEHDRCDQEPLEQVIPRGLRSQHRQQHHWCGQDRCSPEPTPLGRLLVVVVVHHVSGLVVWIALLDSVADLPDGCGELLRVGVRPQTHHCGGSGEIDGGRFHALLSTEDTFDSDCARGAGHPVDIELNYVARADGVSRRRHTPAPRWLP